MRNGVTGHAGPLSARCRVGLLIMLLVGAGLRFAGLSANPPGLHPDEAANAWNAECLLSAGRDFAGARWPVFSMRTLGENRTTLFVYVLLPFQALLGMSEWTVRVPNAVAGLACIALAFWLCLQLFDDAVALAAAAFVAIMPWSIHLSRWGHEGALTPLLAMIPVAGLVWLIRGSTVSATARAIIAGAAAAVCCYGYPAARLFIPPLVLGGLAILALMRRSGPGLSGAPPFEIGLAQRDETEKNVPRPISKGGISPRTNDSSSVRTPLLAYALAFGAILAPLAWQHLADAERMNRRAARLWNWNADDSLATRIANVATRYVDHFSFDFLFASGDHYEAAWASGFGVLPVVFLPVLLIGAIRLCVDARCGSLGARLMLLWLVCYPLGDVLTRHMSGHILRGSPGIAPLAITAAIGAMWSIRELTRRRLPTIRFAVIAAFCLIGAQELWRFAVHYYVDRPRETAMRQVYMADLVAACAWIRPRLREFDSIYFTATDVDTPFVITAVALRYDPRDWFASPREIDSSGEWDRYFRYGNVHFLYDRSPDQAIRANQQILQKLLFIVRDGELFGGTLLHRLKSTDGHADLVMIEISRHHE